MAQVQLFVDLKAARVALGSMKNFLTLFNSY